MAVVIEWEFLRLVEEQRQALRLTIEELAARGSFAKAISKLPKWENAAAIWHRYAVGCGGGH